MYGYEFFDSYKYICSRFGISSSFQGSVENKVDTSFIKKFERKKEKYDLQEIDSKLLNSFYVLYHQSWLKDGISKRSMSKFNILFSIRENKVIIPHFDVADRLLGIRGRALNQDEIDAGYKYMPVFHKGKMRKHPTGANIFGLNRTKEDIIRYKTIVLFESEKSVLQLDTMYPEVSIGGAISGSSLTDYQIQILLNLGVKNVVLGLDKEFKENGTNEEKIYKEKIASGFLNKLVPYFNTSILWDTEDLLEEKDSPTDKGQEVFKSLWDNRIFV